MQHFQKPIKWHSLQPYSVNAIFILSIRGHSSQDCTRGLYLPSTTLSGALRLGLALHLLLQASFITLEVEFAMVHRNTKSLEAKRTWQETASLSQKALRVLQETPWNLVAETFVTPFTRNPCFWIEAGCLFKYPFNFHLGE